MPDTYRTPQAAATAFRDNITEALNCITNDYIDYSSQAAASGEIAVISLGDGDPVRLQTPDPRNQVFISMIINYRVSEDNQRDWRVHTTGYFHTLEDGKHEILAYHWEPDNAQIRYPHMHLKAGSGVRLPSLQSAHLPTGRVLIEDVIWLAIREFGVLCTNQDADQDHANCRATLNRTRAIFDHFQSWGTGPVGDIY